jgi:stage II sporulation protein D
MRTIVTLISLAVTLGVTSAAHAATIFAINGGGNGHGIGMSQYGAYGYALHGQSYQFILAHYYQGTKLGSTDGNRVVRVLLGTGHPRFSGASAAGKHKLNPALTYSVRTLPKGGLGIYTGSGKLVGKFSSPLSVTGSGPLNLAGRGTYRGALEFAARGKAVRTVDAVALDDYVRGVIASEMPASWPEAALEAQAVAARTYAITSDVGGSAYQLYPDTRSQMYGGVAAETAASDAAVAATRGQIVTYNGAPATTYFFASSGGHTEDVQNVWLGTAPEPWLKGVSDPYDGAGGDPYHRWSERMPLRAAARKLGRLVPGRLRGIHVTERGVSPRIVRAEVVGTKGRTSVTGPQLQSVFGLMSTYMRFTTVSATRVTRHVKPHMAVESWALATLTGNVFPAVRRGVVLVQVWRRHAWRGLKRVRVGAGGAWQAQVSDVGRYRVLYAGVVGPTITLG